MKTWGILECTCVSLVRDNIDPTAFAVKHDFAFNQSKQRVVFALSDTGAGMPFVAHLANQNVASDDFFAAKFLDAASLCIGVATVAAGPLSLLVCHISTCKFGSPEIGRCSIEFIGS